MGNKKSFTLSELIIVITVIGIIAVLVVPQLIRRQMEIAKRTKLKKAMTVYDFMMNKMIIENDLKSNQDLENWCEPCSNSAQYFKITAADPDDTTGCRFKTSDGVWWDITNIQQPIVAFDLKNLDKDKALSADNTDAFSLVGHYG